MQTVTRYRGVERVTGMQVAVCCPDAEEARRICQIIEDTGAKVHQSVDAVTFSSEAALWRAFLPGCFRGAVIGFGDVQGFLCARKLREADSACRVILLDDTDRYAIRGLRIHLSDFLVRPLEEARFRAAAENLFN